MPEGKASSQAPSIFFQNLMVSSSCPAEASIVPYLCLKPLHLLRMGPVYSSHNTTMGMWELNIRHTISLCLVNNLYFPACVSHSHLGTIKIILDIFENPFSVSTQILQNCCLNLIPLHLPFSSQIIIMF